MRSGAEMSQSWAEKSPLQMTDLATHDLCPVKSSIYSKLKKARKSEVGIDKVDRKNFLAAELFLFIKEV